MPHDHSMQRGEPTVGALGDAVLDENRRAMDIIFPSIHGYKSSFEKTIQLEY